MELPPWAAATRRMVVWNSSGVGFDTTAISLLLGPNAIILLAGAGRQP